MTRDELTNSSLVIVIRHPLYKKKVPLKKSLFKIIFEEIKELSCKALLAKLINIHRHYYQHHCRLVLHR